MLPPPIWVAKVMEPQTEKIDRQLKVERGEVGTNFLDALSNGTTQGLKLALNVGAMLLVFIAFVALLNGILGFVGRVGINGALADWSGGGFETLSLEAVAAYLFAPVAWMVGIENGDVLQVGQLLGKKMVLNEFFAYLDLGQMKAAGSLSPRTIYLATFALCGFANFGSVGIQLAGIGGIAPSQRQTLAELGFRALLGGTIASLATTCVAGFFYTST